SIEHCLQKGPVRRGVVERGGFGGQRPAVDEVGQQHLGHRDRQREVRGDLGDREGRPAQVECPRVPGPQVAEGGGTGGQQLRRQGERVRGGVERGGFGGQRPGVDEVGQQHLGQRDRQREVCGDRGDRGGRPAQVECLRVVGPQVAEGGGTGGHHLRHQVERDRGAGAAV